MNTLNFSLFVVPKEKANKFITVLQTVYGINWTLSFQLISNLGLSWDLSFKETPFEILKQVDKFINLRKIKLKQTLFPLFFLNIKKLVDLGHFKAFRFKRGLPVNSQRTHSNSQTARRLNKIIFKDFLKN